VTAAVLLCAGGSTRFDSGQPKLLALFRGRPLVSWALEHVGAAGLDEVIVVVGPADLSEVLTTQVVVDNPEWATGIASSLRAGIAEAARRGHEAVVAGLGDQPLIASSAWSAVAATDSPIAVSSFAGRRTPPVRLTRAVWLLLPSTGDIGARALMRERPDLVREVECEGEPLDIDTTEELARWT
jgi:CTP:molybdopterin cytidylyltransferase MocA